MYVWVTRCCVAISVLCCGSPVFSFLLVYPVRNSLHSLSPPKKCTLAETIVPSKPPNIHTNIKEPHQLRVREEGEGGSDTGAGALRIHLVDHAPATRPLSDSYPRPYGCFQILGAHNAASILLEQGKQDLYEIGDRVSCESVNHVAERGNNVKPGNKTLKHC